MKSTVIAFCLASMLFLCSCKGQTAENNAYYFGDGFPCTHDENFVEPVMKTGRYYLNGDTSSYYINVTETTFEFCDVDLSAVFDSWQPSWYEGNETESDIKFKEEWVAEWTGVKPYFVRTLHGLTDETVLAKEESYTDGKMSPYWFILKDENTITGFGKDGDFILVE